MTRYTDRQPPHHNTLTCYSDYGCRLPECVARKNQAQRELRRKKREGQPPLVDATPVRNHILALQAAGTSAYRIALMAGIDQYTVRTFLPSPSGRRAKKHSCTPDIARKILAVTAEAASSGYMDGTGTRRRIQALAAAGWPLRRQAHYLGLNPSYVGDLIRRTQNDRPIYTATAEKVARVYDDLKTKKPTRHGIEAHMVKRVRARAKAERWPTPKYWDEFPGAIDDPHFEPMYGKTRGELLAADARELFTYGVSVEQAAARIGVTRNHLQQELLRHPAIDETTAKAGLERAA